jgi:hypothetical protein
MSKSDWMELETFSNDIAHAQSSLDPKIIVSSGYCSERSLKQQSVERVSSRELQKSSSLERNSNQHRRRCHYVEQAESRGYGAF